MKKIFTAFAATLYSVLLFAQWNDDTNINTDVAGVNSADISTTATSDGKTWIAFYSQNGSNYDMRAQLLDVNGNKLLGDNGMLVSSRKSGSATYVFNTCVDKDNNLIIAFQYQKTLSTLVCVAYKINEAGQQLWGNGVDLGAGLSPYPTVLSNNDVAIAWTNNSKINYLVVNSDGTISWSAAKEISGGTKSVTRPQLVSFTNNNFGIVYQYVDAGFFGSHLYEQKFDHDGNALWASASKLTDYVTSTFRYSIVTSDEDTTLIGYYANPSGQNRFDAFVQRVNDDGTLPWGARGSDFSDDNTANNELSCFMAHAHGSPYVYATSNISDLGQVKYGISLQKFDMSTGAVLLGNKGKQLLAVSNNAYHDIGISLCDDKPLIVYTDVTNKIYATGLDGNGNPLWTGNKIELASSSNIKYRYGFTNVINSQAVMVWQENRGTEDRPYAQNVSCDGNTGVLPVTLTNLSATQQGSHIKLSWQTVIESNNKGFYVQHSADGKNYADAGFIASKATNGNSSENLYYEFTDMNPFSNNNFYRIKQEDKDGKINYSNTVSVNMIAGHAFRVYPNPVHDIFTVALNENTDQAISITINDATGRKVLSQSLQTENNKGYINITHLAPGIYYIHVNINGVDAVQKIIKE